MKNWENIKWHNAIASTGEEITESSTPNLDDWGIDDYWTCSDWMEWHKAMKSQKGKEYANSEFLKWWYKQSTGAHAISCRSFNTAFRNYMKEEKLYDSLFDGAGLIAKPIGAAQDVASSAINTVSSGSKAIENAVNTLKIMVPIAIIGATLIGGFYLYNKATA